MNNEIIELLEEICDDEIVRQNIDIELFDTGILDSLAFAELLFEIEDRFDIVISPSEISREDFNTPRKIMDLINARE